MSSLVRMVPRRNASLPRAFAVTGGIVMSAVTISALAMAPEVQRTYGESKIQIARSTMKQYEFAGFALWREQHGRACPRSLDELAPYTNHRTTMDPYGNDYMFVCGHGGFVVFSLGEDGRLGTADDLWSDP